jgi:hypothetical protein
LFRNYSSFVIENLRKLPSSKIITNFEELLHEEDSILDVWKLPFNKSSSNLTFMLISNGELVVIESFKNMDGIVEHKKQSYKIANQLDNAKFYADKYFKEKKVYIFSD